MDNIWFWIAIGAAAVCVVALVLMYVLVLAPQKRLRDLCGRLGTLEPAELTRQAAQIPGGAGRIARSIAASVSGPDAADDAGRSPGAAAAEQYKSGVIDEICRSLLPQPLKDRSVGMSFDLSGGIQPGLRRNCAFYDHFFLDENTLCLTVGQVPGSGIAEALFAVVAQTTIRSRLRMGHSLVETMSDVNAQLYDLGRRSTVSAIVCVLNTLNGRLSFVNAGGAIPFLMRSDEGYEWLRTPVYAPLGANESVTYRSEVLRLNQGDRLFLYTEDLGAMLNRDGEEFRTQEFQSALNRSRSKTRRPRTMCIFPREVTMVLRMAFRCPVLPEECRMQYSSSMLQLKAKAPSAGYVGRQTAPSRGKAATSSQPPGTDLPSSASRTKRLRLS